MSSSIEWIPQPSIPFADIRFKDRLIHLQNGLVKTEVTLLVKRRNRMGLKMLLSVEAQPDRRGEWEASDEWGEASREWIIERPLELVDEFVPYVRVLADPVEPTQPRGLATVTGEALVWIKDHERRAQYGKFTLEIR